MEMMGQKGKESGEEFWNLATYNSPELDQLPFIMYPEPTISLCQGLSYTIKTAAVSMLACPLALDYTSQVEFCFHHCVFKLLDSIHFSKIFVEVIEHYTLIGMKKQASIE